MVCQSLINPMTTSRASMAYDSSNKTHKQIHELVSSDPNGVFVFMKGTPKEPQCGYSGMVVQILDAYGINFNSCNVLENEEIRKEIKNYSDWPTIPQVYVKGSFVGGCDILLQMHQNGEIKQLVEEDQKSGDK